MGTNLVIYVDKTSQNLVKLLPCECRKRTKLITSKNQLKTRSNIKEVTNCLVNTASSYTLANFLKSIGKFSPQLCTNYYLLGDTEYSTI